MVADWGFGLGKQRDLIETSGYFVDLAKIVVAISRVLPRDILAKKIRLYQRNGIQPFPGGNFSKSPSCRDGLKSIAGEPWMRGTRPSKFRITPSP